MEAKALTNCLLKINQIAFGGESFRREVEAKAVQPERESLREETLVVRNIDG